jgi:hypothetical protein
VLTYIISSGEFHYQRMPVPELWLVGELQSVMGNGLMYTGYLPEVSCKWNQCYQVMPAAIR